MHFRHGRRWLVGVWCVMLVWTFGGVARPHSTAAAVPAGLTAADWQAITAQLPNAPTAAPVLGQQAYLKASNTDAGDGFGYSVAVDGDTVVVGAPYEGYSGATYVFVRTTGGWSQQAYLKASNTDAGDQFGFSVAVDGDTVVVGAHYEDSNATGINGNQQNDIATNAGAAYVFVRSGTQWSQQAYLKASNTGVADYFGTSVAISGNTIVVGAWNEDSAATGINGNQQDDTASFAGAAYVFVHTAFGVWIQQAYLKASNTNANDYFGYSVAMDNDTIVVGAQGEDSAAKGVDGNQQDNSSDNSGAAYVFSRDIQGVWSQQAYLKASNTGAGDLFGSSVAVSGTTVVVGAPNESSNATGVNGNQQDNSASSSGAAYVFVPFFDNWLQFSYLKASNTGADDLFGSSVAVSGITVVVGAPRESSAATGVNGNQQDNSASSSGAAYVFAYEPTTKMWNQSYLKASNTGKTDLFGEGVAVSGDTVAVGASYEDSSTTGINSTPNENAQNAGAAYVYSVFDKTVYIPLVTR